MKSCSIADLPVLTEDEQDDAAFRVRDRIWAEIADLFDKHREESDLNFAVLGRRIGRSRSQVQRWLGAPMNMTLASAGLLLEGLNADPIFTAKARTLTQTNRAHPCEEARAQLIYKMVLRQGKRERDAQDDAEQELMDTGEGDFIMNCESWSEYEVA